MKLRKQLAVGATSLALLLGAAGSPLLQNVLGTAYGILVNLEPENKTSEDGLVYSRTMDYDYESNKFFYRDEITIYDYVGTKAEITVPAELDGLPVVAVGETAFLGCDFLSSVVLPDGLNIIGKGAFQNCTALTAVTIPDSVTTIEVDAFAGTAISAGCKNSVIYVDGWAVDYAGTLDSVLVLADSTRGIAKEAFKACNTLTSVTMGESLRNIGNRAFSGCMKLSAVTMGSNIESIGIKAFFECPSLEYVTILANRANKNKVQTGKALSSTPTPEPYVTGIGDSAFSGCSKLTTVDIPSKMKSIGEQAFYHCSSLTAVTIPAGVTDIGSSAFQNCAALTAVEIPAGVTAIGYSLFAGCSSLTDVRIPVGVTSIGIDAFCGCTALTSVTIPDGVTRISGNAFCNCPSMRFVSIPVSVTRIDSTAFRYCGGLRDVFYPGTQAQWNAIEFGEYNESLIYNIIHFNSSNIGVAPVTNLKTVSGNAITWTRSPDAVKYYVFLDGEKVATTLNTSYAFQTLVPDTYNYIGVSAVNAAGEQSMSCTVSPKSVAMLEKPTGLSRGSASLSWNAVAGAKSYKVYVINPKNGKFVKTFAGITGTSFTFQGMTDGRSYRLRVCAVDENGVLGRYAATKLFTYKKPAVAPVFNLKNVSGNAVSWTKSADAVSYAIYLNGRKISATRNNFFAFQTLNPGTAYKVSVAAVNAKGQQSPVVSVKFNAVSILSAPTVLQRNSLTLSWSAVKNAKSYKAYLIEVDAKGTSLSVDFKVVAGNVCPFDSAKLEKGKTYQLRVCGIDQNGNLGKYATTKSFTV